jgi:hypothetical protein
MVYWRMIENPRMCFTIGCAGVNPQQFIDICRWKGLTILIDVRGYPASHNVKEHLAQHNILYGAYDFIEDINLITDTDFYVNSKLGLQKLTGDERIVHFIDKLEELINAGHRIGILHSAADPMQDRRAVIAARLLCSRGIDCSHIVSTHPNAVDIEPNEDLERRLMNWYVAHPSVVG